MSEVDDYIASLVRDGIEHQAEIRELKSELERLRLIRRDTEAEMVRRGARSSKQCNRANVFRAELGEVLVENLALLARIVSLETAKDGDV